MIVQKKKKSYHIVDVFVAQGFSADKKCYGKLIDCLNDKNIITVCVNYDLSNGEIYEKLGFNFVELSEPAYHWIKQSKEKAYCDNDDDIEYYLD